MMDNRKQRQPKLTPEKLLNAMPRIGSITVPQLARKVDCGENYVSGIISTLVEQGDVRKFKISGVGYHYERAEKLQIKNQEFPQKEV